ncbi:hypothetical protein V2J09_009186 [Rumex salicifolius]
MASYIEGYPHGLLPYHQQHSLSRAWKGCQPIFPVPGFKQDIIRSTNPDLRTYQLDKQWNSINGFPESSQLMKIESTCSRHVLADTQDDLPDSVLLSFGISERCVRHEKVMKFLMSGTSGAEREGLDFSAMSELIEFQLTITEMHQNHASTVGSRSDSHVELEPSFAYPNGTIHAQECLQNFMDDFLHHPDMSINPDGKISFVGSAIEMRDLLSVLAEFYLPKGSARWSRQMMLVPQFKWGGTVENSVLINEASLTLESLRVAPLKSPLKTKPVSIPKRRKDKKIIRERDLYQKNYFHACESLLSLMMDKKRSRKTVINSLKKSGPELPELLTQCSATIAGTGLAVIFSVICKLAYGRLHFGSTKLLTTSLGVGLFWLSWAVNKLRETIICIRRNPAKLGFEEDEAKMVRTVDKNVNDIFFRVVAVTVVAVLRFA